VADSKTLKYIDPHIHMVSRTTADYQAMAEAGIVAVITAAASRSFQGNSVARGQPLV
jgi:predicted metal-dependent TIM-barrel fold hydrolase